MESLRGQLLIASPSLFDPNFRQSVVLIGGHGEDGAIGVVLNRPSETPAAEAVPSLAELVAEGDPIFVGGPVDPGRVLVLAELDDADVSERLVGSIGFVEDAHDSKRARVFAGFSGWAPGQLEAELADGDWMLEPALPGDVFADNPESLWRTVVERKGGFFRLVATMPPDPSRN